MERRWPRQASLGMMCVVALNLGEATAAASASGGLAVGVGRAAGAAWSSTRRGATRGSGSASCWSPPASWSAPGCSRRPTTRCRSGRRPVTSAPGQRVEADDLVAQRVRFADARRARRLLHRRRRAPGRPRADPQRRRRASCCRGRRSARRTTPAWSRCPSRSSPSSSRPTSSRATWSTSTSSRRSAPTPDGQAQQPPPGRPGAGRGHGRRRARAGVVVRHQRQAPARPRACPRTRRAGVLRPARPLRRTQPDRGQARMKVVLLLAAGAAWETSALARAQRPA